MIRHPASQLPATICTLTVAMTAGDVPVTTGNPDQGFEGYRFVGWSLYDALINWDLSRSDREAGLTPGLAVKWGIDPANNKRWVFELRKGVKFHDGCKFDADVAAWNIQRLIDDLVIGIRNSAAKRTAMCLRLTPQTTAR